MINNIMLQDCPFGGSVLRYATYEITVRATNAGGSYDKTLSLVVKDPKTKILSERRPRRLYQNEPYSYQLKVSGILPFSYQYTGDLPPGLTLSDTGLLSGTPTILGEYKFAVTVGGGDGSDSVEFTFRIARDPNRYDFEARVANAGGNYSKDLFIRVIEYNECDTLSPQIKTTSLGFIRTDEFVQYKLESTAPNATWSYTGLLPPGLTLTQAGLLSGTTTVTGQFTFTVKAENTHGYDEKVLVIHVFAKPKIVTEPLLPSMLINTPYEVQLMTECMEQGVTT